MLSRLKTAMYGNQRDRIRPNCTPAFVSLLLMWLALTWFTQLPAIATDLLVGGFNSNQIIRYNAATGARIGVIAAGDSLDGPTGIAAGPNGKLFVAGFNTNAILAYYGGSGTALGVFAFGGGLDGPGDIVYGADGNLYVGSFENHKVLRYNGSTGAFIDVFASGGGLTSPDGLAFGPDGDLYVCSSGSNSVVRFNGATGAYKSVFVPAGSGGLHDPTGMAFGPDGDLYVSSFFTNSVLRYNGTTGAFKGTFATGGGLSGPRGLAFGPDGNLYVVNPGSNQVLRYNGTTGAFRDVFVSDPKLNGPVYLAFVNTTSVPTILPDHGGNTGSVTVRIIGGDGSSFADGTKVRLAHANLPDIAALNTSITNTMYLTATFDLTGAPPGTRDVIVDVPGEGSRLMPFSFKIDSGGRGQLWADYLGRHTIRRGVDQNVIISYGNRGNIDIDKQLITVSFPQFISWKPGKNTIVAASYTTETGDNVLTIYVPTIAAGSSGAFSLILYAPNTNSQFFLKVRAPTP